MNVPSGPGGARLPSLSARSAAPIDRHFTASGPADPKFVPPFQESSMARAKPEGTLLYAQSGGVTAVINATAAGVIAEARARGVKVLAARNGILGALREELVDTSKESAAAIAGLA